VDDAVSIGQSSLGGNLRWYESVNCGNCGLRIETDGIGFPDAEIRAQLMCVEGVWDVKLIEVKSIVEVLRVCRGALTMNMREVAQRLKALPGPVYSGTMGEAIWLGGLLEKVGESPVLERR